MTMDDSRDAERFAEELDKVLVGRPAMPAGDAELDKDLRFSALLGGLDLSAESRVRASLKAELLGRPKSSVLPWASWGWLLARPRLAAGCACVAALVISSALVRNRPRKQGAGPSFQITDVASRPMEMASFRKLFRDSKPRFDAQFVLPGVPKPGGAAASLSPRQGDRIGQGLARPAIPFDEFKGVGARGGEIITPLNVRDPATFPEKTELDREGYDHISENAFQRPADHPLSTFSIDVDAASYANVRRFLGESRLPPKDAVRIEELVNYFRYDFPEPEGEHPFSITAEVAACPWRAGHKLVRIGIKGRSIASQDLPPSNLAFLIDSSGSMATPDKLPLLKSAFRLLVEQLRDQDRVSIVTYAGSAGLVLAPTPGSRKEDILAAIERLDAGGSTAGGEGIELAYRVAERSFLKGGNNRVILATDGDFNVGITSDGDLVRLIEGKREKGIFLTVLGFGRGNLQDAKMEKLADKGNGHYAYIDDILEARKVFVQEFGGTLLTIAKDVKVQVEFNPARVQAYRLIGYENRALLAEDFNDDKKDAGELGAGHAVTALYEIIPPGVDASLPQADELKYQRAKAPLPGEASREILTVKFRYKRPQGGSSWLIVRTLDDSERPWEQAGTDFRFAAAVAGFGMLLRGSAHGGNLDFERVASMAERAVGRDEGGYRAEFVRLVDRARLLRKD